MKTNLLKTGTALLLALTLSVSAKAQEPTTAMNSTLVPQSWSNLPIVEGKDVKGGMHELGTVNISLGAEDAINALTGNQELPITKRTVGMVVGLFEQGSSPLKYRQYILMSSDGSDADNDVWQEILVTSAWVGETSYLAGDPVSYQGATYFKIDDGNSGATFTPSLWYGISNGGDASLAALTLAGNSLDSIATTATEVTAGGGSASKVVTGAALIEYVNDQLSNTVVDGNDTNDILIWNGTEWTPAADVSITSTGVVTLGDGTNDVVLDGTTGSISGTTITTTGDASIGGDLTLGGTTVSAISTEIGATSSDDSLVTAKAVYDAISELDAQVGDGTVTNQTLRWNGTAWVADGALTNDGTDVTASGTLNADALSTGEFTVDATGNVATLGNISTSGTLNADDDVNLGSTGTVTTVEGTLTVAEAATLSSSLTMNNSAATTITVDGIATDVASAAANDSLVTALAVKTYVDDQLGTGGSLYYGSESAYATVSALADNAEIETYTAVTKANISSEEVDLTNDEFFFVAVPTTWGALNMFIEESPIFDGYIKQVVGDYYVYVMQFAVPGASTAGLTFAIK